MKKKKNAGAITRKVEELTDASAKAFEEVTDAGSKVFSGTRTKSEVQAKIIGGGSFGEFVPACGVVKETQFDEKVIKGEGGDDSFLFFVFCFFFIIHFL